MGDRLRLHWRFLVERGASSSDRLSPTEFVLLARFLFSLIRWLSLIFPVPLLLTFRRLLLLNLEQFLDTLFHYRTSNVVFRAQDIADLGPCSRASTLVLFT